MAQVGEEIFASFENEHHESQSYKWTGKQWEKEPYGYNSLNTDDLETMI